MGFTHQFQLNMPCGPLFGIFVGNSADEALCSDPGYPESSRGAVTRVAQAFLLELSRREKSRRRLCWRPSRL